MSSKSPAPPDLLVAGVRLGLAPPTAVPWATPPMGGGPLYEAEPDDEDERRDLLKLGTSPSKGPLPDTLTAGSEIGQEFAASA